MRKNQKQRLESAGWSVGDAADFLKLSREERQFIETKLALAAGLRKLRANDEYTLVQRREIDRGIAQSQKQYKGGLAFGPFSTAEELVASLHKQTRKGKTKDGKRKAE